MNVNKSNVFQLMKVKGVSQQLAQNIVAYRDKKGLYRTLDELSEYRILSGCRDQETCIISQCMSSFYLSIAGFPLLQA